MGNHELEVTWEKAEEREYEISTFTGMHKYAGTDANIFITLVGVNGVGKEHKLKSKKKQFEKGDIDTFTVKDEDLGFLSNLKIRHDNKGMFPGWLLNKVEVKEDEKVYKFSYGGWLFKNGKGALETELECDGLPVMSVKPQIQQNSLHHHTSKFNMVDEPAAIILRRGQSFKIILCLGRDFRPESDDFYFLLKTGLKPEQSPKSLIVVKPVLPKEFKCKGKDWIYRIYRDERLRNIPDPRMVEVEIYIPANAMPGKYEVQVMNDDGIVYEPAAPVYILFNPWCPDDEVYMEDEAEIKEYVIRQSGQVYVGSSINPRGRQWHFGQFEEVSLKAAMNILEGERLAGRENAVKVSRIVTSKVNSIDNNGILEGNWSGEYEGGSRPTAWMSTPAILEKYLESGEPVKFGQCWVFSAIVTTILRALGIPCRSVTNFSSAHDSDGSCSNDKYLDEEGKEIEDMSSDSVWNFHVWNDAWMARYDLPPGYGGWQAIDATPQERSQGLFQMGPASLRAIKEGEIDMLYDTGFCLAEVNADSIYWEKNKDSDDWEAIYRNKTLVGKRISTKAVGSQEEHEITEDYKFREGSVLERASVKNALIKSKNPAARSTRKDIELEVVPLKQHVHVGSDITIDIKLKNVCNEDKEVSVMVGGQVIRYDGVAQAELEMHVEETTIEGEGEKKIRIKVPSSHYVPYLSEETQVRVVATVRVPETNQFVRGDEIIDLVKPSLEIVKIDEKVRAGVEHELVVEFENPLDFELTGCEMYMDGTIIRNRIYVTNVDNIAANGKMEQTIIYVPENIGKEKKDKKILISLSTKELGGVYVNAKVPVSPPCTCCE